MSIIQKLENSYLGILRVAVIAVSSLLLIAAIALGGWSIQGVLPAAGPKVAAVSVDSKDVLEKVAPEEKRVTQVNEQSASNNAGAKPANAAQLAAYEKTYTMAATFIGKFSGNVQTVNKNGFFEYLDTKLNQYDSDEIKAQYLSGLISVMDSSFKSLRVTAIAGSPMTAAAPAAEQSAETNGMESAIPLVNDKPINMVGSIISSYTELYNKKLASAKARQEERAAEIQRDKATAMMQLYVAAGLFGFFLLVVFLSIVIKIERNLREIAGKP
jgi:hypothetical protein